MSEPRARLATALPCVDDLVAALRPSDPMHCLRPAQIMDTAEEFIRGFPGDVLYAVKCNPEPEVLRALWEGGVRHFDCASLAEVQLVASVLPQGKVHFMHPVKSRPAIKHAYVAHGVRDFVLDSGTELQKILDETDNATDLGLVVRLALPAGAARYDLSGKFGAWPCEAAALLRAARPHAKLLGVSFHVGSQCMDPLAWREAIRTAGEVIRAAGVVVDVLDVGGGFPVAYPGMTPPPLSAFFAEIEASVDALKLPGLKLWSEPGRALVAAGSSVVVQVHLRRDGHLFINDGVYGSLSDAGVPAFRYPARLIRQSAVDCVPFSFFGPTCDSADVMRGPFFLPADIAEGDWIEIGQLGAYGACLSTNFNGFNTRRLFAVRDGHVET
jgi:ornithine decarboxylase